MYKVIVKKGPGSAELTAGAELAEQGTKLQELRQPFLTLVVFLFNRKEVKIFKRSKKQEQEKGMGLQRQLTMLEVSVVFRLRFFQMGTCS